MVRINKRRRGHEIGFSKKNQYLVEINAKIDLKTCHNSETRKSRQYVRFVRTSEFLDDLHSDIEYFRYLCLANIAICGEMSVKQGFYKSEKNNLNFYLQRNTRLQHEKNFNHLPTVRCLLYVNKLKTYKLIYDNTLNIFLCNEL